VLRCPACGQQNPEDAHFCNRCASTLRSPERAITEERKTVTVVFIDLVGFTAQAERLDPEDVRGLLAPYHAHVRTELERRGGTVEKFIGDAVMAVFGAPIAHDDDPERAVRAALAICEWSADQAHLEVRVAVHTGETLVSVGSRAAQGEALVTGDVVNTAARLQAAAPVNGVLVGETTYRATRDAIRYREIAAVTAKGKAEPIAVWEALVPMARVGADLAPAPRTPLVGRERELQQLSSILRRVSENRAAQLVTILGVPGIGKSRLVRELFQLVDAAPELITWRRGRCLPYGERVTYWALAEIVKAEAGILDDDPPVATRDKIRASVARLAMEASEARWLETELGALISASSDGTGAGAETAMAAWRRYLEATADRAPLVLVFEDLHWADDGLLDFVDDLADWLRDVPVLVVATARPELLEQRPAWGGGKANATTVSLQPLADADARRLIRALLEQPPRDADEWQALLDRADGNPLFAEQYVRMLTERGTTGALPESVQGVIAARLDALARVEKDLVQAAAVHGRIFSVSGVAATLGIDVDDVAARLRTLERKEFVRRERRTAAGGETDYAFQHVLLRDVAYGQVPRRRRAELHRRAGDWLGSLGRPSEHAELLAYHSMQALALGRAAGEGDDQALVDRARRSLSDAGERAMALHALGPAAGYFTDALALTTDDDPSRPSLLLNRARAAYAGGGNALQSALEALDALEVAGDLEGATEAATLAARAAWQAGDAAARDRLIARALATIAGSPSSPARAKALTTQTGFLMLAGRFEQAIELGAEAQSLVKAAGLDELHIRLLNYIGCARCCLGDDGGLASIEESIAAARTLGAIPLAINGYANLASELWFFARVAESRAASRTALELAERYPASHVLRACHADRAAWAYLDGRWDEAVAVATGLIEDADAGNPDYSDASLLALRGWIAYARGDLAAAVGDVDRAVELARASDLQAQSQTYATAGLVALATGRRAEAEQLASELAGMGHPMIPALCAPFPTLAEVAWLFHDVGRSTQLSQTVLDPDPIRGPWNDAAQAICQGELARAAGIVERIGHPASAAYAHRRAAEALAAAGREAESAAHLARADAFNRAVA
jgi:class 3 adenylate cyclase